MTARIDRNLTKRTITDWVAYIPTINGVGTPTGVSFFSRRVGDTLQIKFKFVAGTVAATTFDFTLGFNGTNGGITISSSKLPSGENIVGSATRNASGVPPLIPLANAAANTVIRMSYQNQAGINPLSPILGNQVMNIGETLSGFAEVPITGW